MTNNWNRRDAFGLGVLTLLSIGAIVNDWNPLIIALAATVPTIVSIFGTIRNGRKTDLAAQKSDVIVKATSEVKAKADTIIEKAIEIHTLTNSNLSKVSTALEVANTKIDAMQRQITSLIADKEHAATTATSLASAATALAMPHGAIEQKPDTPTPKEP